MALKFNCTKCGQQMIIKFLKVGEVAKCRNCNAEITVPANAIKTNEEPKYDEPIPSNAQGHIATAIKDNSRAMGEGAISALRFFAWLNLIAGIIGAIAIWVTMGEVATPVGIGIGFAFLAEGIFGCALLLVICLMAENLIQIRKNTTR